MCYFSYSGIHFLTAWKQEAKKHISLNVKQIALISRCVEAAQCMSHGVNWKKMWVMEKKNPEVKQKLQKYKYLM